MRKLLQWRTVVLDFFQVYEQIIISLFMAGFLLWKAAWGVCKFLKMIWMPWESLFFRFMNIFKLPGSWQSAYFERQLEGVRKLWKMIWMPWESLFFRFMNIFKLPGSWQSAYFERQLEGVRKLWKMIWMPWESWCCLEAYFGGTGASVAHGGVRKQAPASSIFQGRKNTLC